METDNLVQPVRISFPIQSSRILLAILIFIEGVGLSSFSTQYNFSAKLINRSALAIIIALLMVYIIIVGIRQLTYRRIGMLTLVVICAIFIWSRSDIKNPIFYGVIVGFACFGSGLRLQQIAESYFWGLVSAQLTIIFLSLVNILPRSGYASKVSSYQSNYREIEFFWGFEHPNAFGTMLMAIFFAMIIAFPGIRNRLKILIGVILFTICVYIAAGTAAVGILIVSVGLVFNQALQKHMTFYTYVAGMMACLLPIFSVWVGTHVNSGVSRLISAHVASRPQVWNFYLLRYPIKFISDSFSIDLSLAGTPVLGNGALDGAYIYTLVHWGIFILIVLLASWLVLLYEAYHYSNFSYLVILICATYIIIAFPESPALFFYENFCCLGLGLLQLSREEKINALSFK